MALPTAQSQLDSLNARILDVSFLLNGQEHALSRILLFRATLSQFDGTESVFQTLLSLRTEVEREISLLNTLLVELMARRIVAYRQVESQTRPRPGALPAVLQKTIFNSKPGDNPHAEVNPAEWSHYDDNIPF